jgi:hypothetical protein
MREGEQVNTDYLYTKERLEAAYRNSLTLPLHFVSLLFLIPSCPPSSLLA